MHVLGLTDMRVDEMREPFDELGRRGTLLTVDPDEGVGAYLSAAAAGSRRIERRDSDAVLAYNGSGLVGVVGAALARYHGIPFLIRLNGDIFRQHRETAVERVRGREWRSLAAHLPFALVTRATFGRADGFVPVAGALTGTVNRQTGCPTDRIAPAPNPAPLDEFAPPEDAARGGEGNRLLTVTNLSFRGKYEGVTSLVDGVVPLLRRRPELEYAVAGDGRYLDRLRRYLDGAASGDVRDRIRTPGFVEDVAERYWDADVFLYASAIDGYPNVILEAQAAGLPVVTNPAYGIAEQVDDGESGLFVDPTDPDELARTVASLLDDPAERERLGRNARERVETENSPDVVASRLLDAVRRVVADESTPAPRDAGAPAGEESPSDAGRPRTSAVGGDADGR